MKNYCVCPSRVDLKALESGIDQTVSIILGRSVSVDATCRSQNVRAGFGQILSRWVFVKNLDLGRRVVRFPRGPSAVRLCLCSSSSILNREFLEQRQRT